MIALKGSLYMDQSYSHLGKHPIINMNKSVDVSRGVCALSICGGVYVLS